MSAVPLTNGHVDLATADDTGMTASHSTGATERTPAERRHELVSELFHTVCNLSVNQQQDLLAQGHIDPTIASEVLAMLGAERRHGGMMDSPIVFADEVLKRLGDPSSSEPPEPEIGPYRIGSRLGEGACAVVYRCQQERPIQRTVAVKVLRSGVDGGAVRARFEMERNALAMMRHPHIAQLYDAGLSELGRPYFAMELVEGAPIVEYCVEAGLSTQQRIELFLQVCDAVQHAHLKGIIHRDLKPSNILVTQVDMSPFVKVIDFGIARALEAGRELTMRWTMPGDLVGTLEYMSPEQARGDLAAVDMLSDVYALGVILYELLCGRRPFSFAGVAVHVAVRRLLEEAPDRLGRDEKALRGDLELIVSRAMAHRPQDRYGGVAMLADDLRRWLRGEALSVRPDGSLQRLARLARKHRTVTAAAATILLTLVAASAVSGVAWWRARTSYLETVSLVEGLLGDALPMVDAIGDRGLQRALFSRSLAAAEMHLKRSPGDRRMHVLRLRAMDGLGDLDLNDGLFDTCRRRRAKLQADITSLLERWPTDPDLRSRLSIAMVKNADVGTVDPLPAYLEALSIDKALAEAHPDHAHYLDNLCWSYERVAAQRQLNGEVKAAHDLHRQRLALAEQIVGLEPNAHLRRWNLLMAHANMANVAQQLHEPSEFDHIVAAREQAEWIVGACPRNRLYLFYLSLSLKAEADGLVSMGRPDEAATLRARAEGLDDSVRKIDRQTFEETLASIEDRIEMAGILSAAGKIVAAIGEAKKACDSIKCQPESHAEHEELIRLGAVAFQRLAMLQQRNGEGKDAMTSAGESASAYRHLLARGDVNPRIALEFARLLASFPTVAIDEGEAGRAIETALIDGNQPEIIESALQLCEELGDRDRADSLRRRLHSSARRPDLLDADDLREVSGEIVGGF